MPELSTPFFCSSNRLVVSLTRFEDQLHSHPAFCKAACGAIEVGHSHLLGVAGMATHWQLWQIYLDLASKVPANNGDAVANAEEEAR